MLRKKTLRIISFVLFTTLGYQSAVAQTSANDSLLANATLENVINYALNHQPVVQQSLIDEAIADQTIKSSLADWFPQVNFNYALQHNFQVQTSVIAGNPVRLGVNNTSYGQFTLKQNLFNRDIIIANRTKDVFRQQAQQNTTSNKIEVAAEVAKAFYAVLATMQQVSVSEGDIARLERSLKDAYNQYQAGIVDKIDYKRTTISLNNAKATRSTNEALLNSRMTYLKSLMNYPESADLILSYDSTRLESAISLDTALGVDYTNRIEYQLLQTRRRLLQSNVDYNKLAYFPTVAANGGYYLNYQNNKFSKLYSNNFPNSFAALTLTVPLFQGGKRIAEVRRAELELKRTDWDLIDLKQSVNAEYERALAVYKGSLANYVALKENVELAQEVYDVVNLQYKSGIKTYLEVITSETDLRNARINYINALYLLLSSKIDVQKSLGQINY